MKSRIIELTFTNGPDVQLKFNACPYNIVYIEMAEW